MGCEGEVRVRRRLLVACFDSLLEFDFGLDRQKVFAAAVTPEKFNLSAAVGRSHWWQ